MTTDLLMLVLACLLAFVHSAIYSTVVMRQLGIAYSAGPRDENLQPTGMAGRLRRAHINFLETFPLFAAAVLVAHVTGAADATTALASQAYVIFRALYLPAYASGIAYLRTAIWFVATGAILVILWQSVF
ncbi:MAG: MAPEG family protein [Hyphomicrobiales bacterium]|nr:MAPEG family protein [Hyphomicrobiales bacterium]